MLIFKKFLIFFDIDNEIKYILFVLLRIKMFSQISK